MYQVGAAQAVFRRRQGGQARRFNSLATALALAVATFHQAQAGQADLAHPRLRLGEQAFEHFVVLALHRLLGEWLRARSRRIAAARAAYSVARVSRAVAGSKALISTSCMRNG